MKKILFPTAYTTHARVAFRYAQRLAQYFGAEITLVHIYESLSPALVSDSGVYREFKDQNIQRFAEEQWDREMEKISNFAAEMAEDGFEDIPLSFVVTDGEVVQALLEIKDQNDFDLVVMGMRRHSLGGRLLGNTTYSLIDKMDCPLFLVPPDSHYMGLDKIVFGTAFEFGDHRAINFLLEWSSIFSAKLHLLHVCRSVNIQKATSQMADLMENYQEEEAAKRIKFQLLEGDIEKVLEDYVTLTRADVLAIFRRKRGFWQEIVKGSLTKKLVEESKVPLLVLKA